MPETPFERQIRIERQLRQQAPPEPTSSVSLKGRAFWRLSKLLLGALLICSGLLSAAMLWVIFGSSLEPRHSPPGTTGLRAEATTDAPLSRQSTASSAGLSRHDMKPAAEAALKPAPPSARAAEQPKPADQPNPEAQAEPNQPQPIPTRSQPIQIESQPVQTRPLPTQAEVQPTPPQPQPLRTEPPDRGAGAAPQRASTEAADQRAGLQCSVSLCAATYKSFNEADCTYQPFGGGPRHICELHAEPTTALRQHSGAATDPYSEVTDKPLAAAVQPATKSEASDKPGLQCNRTACAATYKSFSAADCTYQPLGGGPRTVCELSKASAEASQQKARAAAASEDTISGPDDRQIGETAQEAAESATADPAGPQCNRSLCAAAYHSFHAGDCTYQPEGGGPRRICER